MANPWLLQDVGLQDPAFIHRLVSWASVADCFMRFTNHHGTEKLLVSLAMAKIDSCPFPLDDVASLKESVIVTAAGFGHQIERRSGDRTDVPLDYQFLDLLLRVAKIPRRVSVSMHSVSKWGLERGCRDRLHCSSPKRNGVSHHM